MTENQPEQNQTAKRSVFKKGEWVRLSPLAMSQRIAPKADPEGSRIGMVAKDSDEFVHVIWPGVRYPCTYSIGYIQKDEHQDG